MLKKMIIMVLALFILNPEARGDEKLITLATHESPPYTGEKLKNRGVLTEIVTRAFEHEGYSVNIKVVPWKRALEMSKRGVYEGLYGIWHRKEREQWFIYSEPLIANEIILIKRKGSSISFNGDYKSLQSYRFGYIRGYAYPPGLEAIKDLIEMEVVADNLQNLKKLARGRLDLIIIDRLLSRYLIATQMIGFGDALEEIDYVLAKDMNYVAFSKKIKGIEAKADAFNRGIEYLKKEGIIEEILNKHGF